LTFNYWSCVQCFSRLVRNGKSLLSDSFFLEILLKIIRYGSFRNSKKLQESNLTSAMRSLCAYVLNAIIVIFAQFFANPLLFIPIFIVRKLKEQIIADNDLIQRIQNKSHNGSRKMNVWRTLSPMYKECCCQYWKISMNNKKMFSKQTRDYCVFLTSSK